MDPVVAEKQAQLIAAVKSFREDIGSITLVTHLKVQGGTTYSVAN
jgi:hypothetical protein